MPRLLRPSDKSDEILWGLIKYNWTNYPERFNEFYFSNLAKNLLPGTCTYLEKIFTRCHISESYTFKVNLKCKLNKQVLIFNAGISNSLLWTWWWWQSTQLFKPTRKNSGRNPPNPCENSHFCERNLTKSKYFHNELAISGLSYKTINLLHLIIVTHPTFKQTSAEIIQLLSSSIYSLILRSIKQTKTGFWFGFQWRWNKLWFIGLFSLDWSRSPDHFFNRFNTTQCY